MMNTHGVETSNIKVEDRVKVTGAGTGPTYREAQWGTVVDVAPRPADGKDFYVHMDDTTLRNAQGYKSDNVVGNYYFAFHSEVTEHTPQIESKVQEGATATMYKVEPVCAATKSIKETLAYLHTQTGREWCANVQSIDLNIQYDPEGTRDTNTLTVFFAPKGA